MSSKEFPSLLWPVESRNIAASFKSDDYIHSSRLYEKRPIRDVLLVRGAINEFEPIGTAVLENPSSHTLEWTRPVGDVVLASSNLPQLTAQDVQKTFAIGA
jgi:hypothetical protein